MSLRRSRFRAAGLIAALSGSITHAQMDMGSVQGGDAPPEARDPHAWSDGVGFTRGDEARTELLWGHAFATYWDTQVGVRYDSGAGPNRSWLAAGIEGLAPYRP